MFKSYRCEKLNKTLHFLPDKIKFCCSCAEGPGVVITDFSNIDKEEIIKEKKRIQKLLKRGIIPSVCKGCVDYKEIPLKERVLNLFSPQKDDFLVKHIIVDHFKQCDCKCIYCSQEQIYETKKQQYEILPLVKQLYASKMIDSYGLKAEFQGGSISLLKEFDALMEEFYNHGCIDFVVLMNAIKYMPILEKIGCNEKSHIGISLDCGCRETFQKIKGLDLFDETIENIKKLRANSNVHIELKYIIIQGINDNIEELEKFLFIARNIGGIEPISLEIDYRNTILSQFEFKIPAHYYEMFDFAEQFCKKHNILFCKTPHTSNLLKNGIYKPIDCSDKSQ